MTTNDTATAAARRGAAKLDEFFPTWDSALDSDRLDTDSLDNCPLGQAVRAAGLYDFFRDSSAWGVGMRLIFGGDWCGSVAQEHGFEAGVSFSHAELSQAWQDLVRKRVVTVT